MSILNFQKYIDNNYQFINSLGEITVKLHELQKGKKGTIKSIQADKALKSRFNSFGICKEQIVCVEELTLAKETIEIKIGRTKIALRVSEAQQIEVEPC